MTIDMHAHWLPEAFCDAMRARSTPPFIRRKDDGREYLESSFNSSPLAQRESAEQRIIEMDKAGVACGVLSLTPVYGVERLPSAEAVPLCQAFNDAVAAVCAQYPGRFSGLAALPVADMQETLSEFHRIMAMPGMVGALLPGDGFLSTKRAEKFRPLFEAANALGAVFLVHYAKIADDPEAPKVDASDNGHSRVGTLDMQARLSSNMITFCMTDFLKSFPNVTVLSHNLGGNIPFEVDRLDHRSLLDRPQDELPSKRIREASVLVDCNSLGAKAIELAVDCYGVERIVYGSDGTGFGMDWTNKAIADARISDAEKAAILHNNAARALARVRRPQ
ncbi:MULTISPECIES: amidohydrolase family protein [unclassified Beijerinckia]|uniref:amidohydrolase family protein n=1 Tax=unclassified Beijerinckia TaxID=2638183 RepID=UPI000895E507|nr:MULTISPECIES: amidohydrolase family protein [unclassified Beijerinckia]MDH7798188.1 putative TIM-barrel fold metal-dependent hydrolase [Beijerinckia sp. GAS462]SED12187.1 Predicted metal-dependent hydrolase, TIM-barrel fold [Beijerinckia sp. 28-YEA-48]